MTTDTLPKVMWIRRQGMWYMCDQYPPSDAEAGLWQEYIRVDMVDEYIRDAVKDQMGVVGFTTQRPEWVNKEDLNRDWPNDA